MFWSILYYMMLSKLYAVSYYRENLCDRLVTRYPNIELDGIDTMVTAVHHSNSEYQP